MNGLEPSSSYEVSVRATEYHETPGDEYRSSFSTNGSSLQMDDVAPDMEHMGYMDESCQRLESVIGRER